jgi:hypothetical protein
MGSADSSISLPSVEKSLYDKVTTVLEKIFKPPPHRCQVKKCRSPDSRSRELQGHILQHRAGALTPSVLNSVVNSVIDGDAPL